MTDKEIKKYIQEMKEFTKKLSPSISRRMLVRAGICTKEGNLKEPYND